jgi:hypothetical protein
LLLVKLTPQLCLFKSFAEPILSQAPQFKALGLQLMALLFVDGLSHCFPVDLARRGSDTAIGLD